MSINNPKKDFKRVLALLCVFAMLIAFIPAFPVMAATVQTPAVTLSNSTAGASGVDYTISFKNTNALAGGNKITLMFGHDITNGASTFDKSQITINNGDISVISATYQFGNSYSLIEITLGPCDVQPNSQMTIKLTGLYNPVKAQQYTFNMYTTTDTDSAVAKYTIIPGSVSGMNITVQDSAYNNQVVPVTINLVDANNNPTSSNVATTVYLGVNDNSNQPVSATVYGFYSDPNAQNIINNNTVSIAAYSSGTTVYLKYHESESSFDIGSKIIKVTANNGASLTAPEKSITVYSNESVVKNVDFVIPQTVNVDTYGATNNLKVTLKDSFGNTVETNATVYVGVYGINVTGDDINWQGVTSSVYPNQAEGAISSDDNLVFGVTYKKACDATIDIRVVANGTTFTKTQAVKFVPGANNSIAVTYTKKTQDNKLLIDSGLRTAVTLTLKDQFGNDVPQTVDTAVYLAAYENDGTTPRTSTKFYNTVSDTTYVDYVVVPKDQTSVTFYVYDVIPQDGPDANIVIKLISGALSNTINASVVGAHATIFDVVPEKNTLEVNMRTPITITLKDQYGKPYSVTNDTTLNVSGLANGKLYDKAVGGTDITNDVTLSAYSSSITVYYQAPSSVPNGGKTTITVSALSVEGSADINIVPAGYVATTVNVATYTGYSTTATVGNRIKIQVNINDRDQHGNLIAQTEDRNINLLVSGSAKVYDSATGGNRISTVTIQQGQVYAYAYIENTKAERVVVSAYDSMSNSFGTLDLTFDPDSLSKLEMTVVNNNYNTKTATLKITALDVYGNKTTTGYDNLIVDLNDNNAGGYFNDASNNKITQATISSTYGDVTVYYHYSINDDITITATAYNVNIGALVAKTIIPPPPTPDTQAPGEVTVNGLIEYYGDENDLIFNFTTPADNDISYVKVYLQVYGVNGWINNGPWTIGDIEPNTEYTGYLPVNNLNVILGKTKVRFYVTTVDESNIESQGIYVGEEGYTLGVKLNVTSKYDGWTTFSIPVRPVAGTKLIGDVLNANDIEIAYKYNAETQSWVQVDVYNNDVNAMDAFMIKLKDGVNSTVAQFTPDTMVLNTVPASKQLKAGYNLVGSWDNDDVSTVLSSINGKWTNIAKPFANNGDIDASITPNNATYKTLSQHIGYWIYMLSDGTLVSNKLTPIYIGNYSH